MEIMVKLSESQQKLLISAGKTAAILLQDEEMRDWQDIAEKIRRTQEDEWALEFNLEPPVKPVGYSDEFPG